MPLYSFRARGQSLGPLHLHSTCMRNMHIRCGRRPLRKIGQLDGAGSTKGGHIGLVAAPGRPRANPKKQPYRESGRKSGGDKNADETREAVQGRKGK